jgi:hypothetical protein
MFCFWSISLHKPCNGKEKVSFSKTSKLQTNKKEDARRKGMPFSRGTGLHRGKDKKCFPQKGKTGDRSAK